MVDFDDLDVDPMKEPAKDQEEQRFPCQHCGGSGKYHGPRVHQTETRCFSCNGRGYFKTSAQHRMKQRDKRRERKAKQLEEARQALWAEHGELLGACYEMLHWNDFARSIWQQYQERGQLSEKQVAAAWRMVEKVRAKERERAEQEAAPRESFPGLVTLFNAASGNLKFPKLHLTTEAGDPVVVSLAGPNSRNPGWLNVTDGGPFGDNRFYGRIQPDGTSALCKNVPEDVVAVLRRVSDDPDHELKGQGARTGKCCCCGKTLTDPASVDKGIGPICESNWGL